MGFKLQPISTPEGFLLAKAYSNIDFFSYHKQDNLITFRLVIYKDEEASKQNKEPLVRYYIEDSLSADSIDFTQDVRAQIYAFIKNQTNYLEKHIESEGKTFNFKLSELKDKYELFIGATDVLEKEQEFIKIEK